MLIDTHTHLDFQSFNDDREEVLARAKDTGVEKMINCGSAWEGSLASVELSEKYPQVFAAVGLHPHETAYAKKNLNYISKLEELADNDKVVAIGEIGLDYFEMANIKEEQKELFIPQLELAEKLGLPVILHARDSYADVYEIVKDKKLKAVLHCFSGDLKQAEKFLNLGFMISFTGIITFAKTDKLVKVVEKVSLDSVMIETDCPFLAPEPHRGSRAEPAHVKRIAEKIAEIKDVSFEEVAKRTTENAEIFFKLD